MLTTTGTTTTPFRLISTSWIDCGQHRTSSRSVSWNADGTYLAMASSDRVARIWTITTEGGGIGSDNNNNTTTTIPGAGVNNSNVSSSTTTASSREVLVVTGHTEAVTKVRFHPTHVWTLCTAALDTTVRLWDVRDATQRAMGKIDINTGKEALAVEWCGVTAGQINPANNNTLSPVVGNDPSPFLLAVTEIGGDVHVYDVRKLSTGSAMPVSTTTTATTTSNTATQPPTSTSQVTTTRSTTPTTAVCSWSLKPLVCEACTFAPDGKHLIVAAAHRGMGMSQLRVLPITTNATMSGSNPTITNPLTTKTPTTSTITTSSSSNNSSSLSQADEYKTGTKSQGSSLQSWSFPAHAGPIYCMAMSRFPDNSIVDNHHQNSLRMVTGGADSVVGLWDVNTMVCTHVIPRRTKFIRSVAFSPPIPVNDHNHHHRNDQQCRCLVAISNEEDTIDIADASTGALVGLVPLVNMGNNSTSLGSGGNNNGNLMTLIGGGRSRGGYGSAEEIAWHPKEHFMLACARTSESMSMMMMAGSGGGGGGSNASLAPVTVIKLNIEIDSSA